MTCMELYFDILFFHPDNIKVFIFEIYILSKCKFGNYARGRLFSFCCRNFKNHLFDPAPVEFSDKLKRNGFFDWFYNLNRNFLVRSTHCGMGLNRIVIVFCPRSQSVCI